MRHHTGNFTRPTSYALLAVRHHKTVHDDLLFWLKPDLFCGY
jgi:hypothetical protein